MLYQLYYSKYTYNTYIYIYICIHMIILYYYRQLWPKITPHPTWAMGDQAATGTSDEAEESIQHRGQPLHSLGGQSWVKMSVFFCWIIAIRVLWLLFFVFFFERCLLQCSSPVIHAVYAEKRTDKSMRSIFYRETIWNHMVPAVTLYRWATKVCFF